MVTVSDNDGYWVLSEANGRVLMSIWSNREYAEHFLSNVNWADTQVESITLEEFETDVKPFLIAGGYLLNVHSIDSKRGFPVTLDEFVRDLDGELEKYE